MDILTVDELPPVVRGANGRGSEERAALLASLTDGNNHIIPGVEDRTAHNRLQQRIRNLAKKHGINITVRYNPEEKITSFGPITAKEVVEDEATVAASAKNGKTKATAKSE
jgi:hypothetical protein